MLWVASRGERARSLALSAYLLATGSGCVNAGEVARDGAVRAADGLVGGDGTAEKSDVPSMGDIAAAPDDVAMGGGDVGADASLGCPPGMRSIPGGTFDMGQPGIAEPVHPVRLSPYCIDLTEVTLAAYHMCTAEGCTAPNVGNFCNEGMPGRDQHPMNCVDWNQAHAYCQWRGIDLPTEAQWEFAARGSDGRSFPWGNSAPGSQLCWGVPTRTSTCPVQSFPGGDSPFGVSDLAGNVWEWTRDWYGLYPSPGGAAIVDPSGPPAGVNHVLRGGSYNMMTPEPLRSAYRYNDYRAPSPHNHISGFRCARGPR